MSITEALLLLITLHILSEFTFWEKLEIFSVIVGVSLLVLGHIGWYREQEGRNHLVSAGLFLGSLLLGMPLMIATLIDRSQDQFLILNELGSLAVSLENLLPL